MKQNNLLAIFIAVLIIVGAFFVFLKNFDNPKLSQKIPKETKNQLAKDTIIGILQSTQAQQCNFSLEEQGVKTVGVVYVQGSNARADLTMVRGEQESDIDLIRNENQTYIWGTAFPKNTGLKLNLTPDEFSSSIGKYFNPTKEVSYNCISQAPDSSVFTPPGDINFLETKIP